MHIKGLPVIVLMLISVPIESASVKMYSRAAREKWVADSLRWIDSTRIADSRRIADSLAVARYSVSDSIMAVEKRRQASDTTVHKAIYDTGIVPIPGEVDNISGRTIIIDPANPCARIVDSLQKNIDSLNSALHDADGRFKEMKGYSITEKQRYILFLLRNKMKDTASVLTYCNSLLEILKIKQDMLIAIRNSQDPNTKHFIQRHIEKHRQRIASLNNFILALSPKLPAMPERQSAKKITEQ